MKGLEDGNSEGIFLPPLYSTGIEEQLYQTKTPQGSFVRNMETKSLKGSKGTSLSKSEFYHEDLKLSLKDKCCYFIGCLFSIQPAVIGLFLLGVESQNVCAVEDNQRTPLPADD